MISRKSCCPNLSSCYYDIQHRACLLSTYTKHCLINGSFCLRPSPFRRTWGLFWKWTSKAYTIVVVDHNEEQLHRTRIQGCYFDIRIFLLFYTHFTSTSLGIRVNSPYLHHLQTISHTNSFRYNTTMSSQRCLKFVQSVLWVLQLLGQIL